MPRSDSLLGASDRWPDGTDPREGLSSSVIVCPCIPRPIRRRVLRGCDPSSSPLPWPSPKGAGLGSLLSRRFGRQGVNDAADFALRCGLQACSPSV